MKKSFFLCIYAFISIQRIWAQPEILPFTTDFCTSYPEGTHDEPKLWQDCCLEHDLYFWAGGSQTDRSTADLGLYQCVAQAGALWHARVMYYAVRVGGYSPVKFKTKKWGNGWSERVTYEALSIEETARLINDVQSVSSIPTNVLQSFSRNLWSRLE